MHRRSVGDLRFGESFICQSTEFNAHRALTDRLQTYDSSLSYRNTERVARGRQVDLRPPIAFRFTIRSVPLFQEEESINY